MGDVAALLELVDGHDGVVLEGEAGALLAHQKVEGRANQVWAAWNTGTHSTIYGAATDLR
jgi:hypothetical protein